MKHENLLGFFSVILSFKIKVIKLLQNKLLSFVYFIFVAAESSRKSGDTKMNKRRPGTATVH